jgi:hypothetical protein
MPERSQFINNKHHFSVMGWTKKREEPRFVFPALAEMTNCGFCFLSNKNSNEFIVV